MSKINNLQFYKPNLSMNTYFNSFYEFIVTLFLTFVGYISPLKNIAHLMLFFFFIDVVYGYLVDRKLNKAKFKPSIVWCKTMPRIVLSIVLLIMSYLLDKVSGQDVVHTYKIIGWFICSLLFLSILKNGYILTSWSAFRWMKTYIKSAFEKETYIDINEKQL